MKITSPFRCAVVFVCLMILSGCGSNSIRLQNLAKSDIALVADAHIQEINHQLELLITKLYKRNPHQLKKSPGQLIKSRLNVLFSDPATLQFKELGGLESTAAMRLCFDETFKGDRVFALGVGLRGMLYRAYNKNTELFMFDQLDAQKLYNSARNMEILAWRLSNNRKLNGALFLLSNNANGKINLSFERLFGKMIALQDMMANITAERSKRTINKIIYSIASAVFLPVG